MVPRRQSSMLLVMRWVFRSIRFLCFQKTFWTLWAAGPGIWNTQLWSGEINERISARQLQKRNYADSQRRARHRAYLRDGTPLGCAAKRPQLDRHEGGLWRRRMWLVQRIGGRRTCE